MKTHNHLSLFLFCFIGVLSTNAQNTLVKDEFDKLTFNVQTNKSEYFPLEPIFLQMEVSNETETSLSVLSALDFKRITLEIDYNGAVKRFNSPFLTGPARSGIGMVLPKGKSMNENVALETYLAEFFPQYGQYKVRVILNNGRDNRSRKEIKSDVIEIEIKEPTGIDKDAVEFLRQNQGQSLFWWKPNRERESLKTCGKPLVEEFANRFSESVFGEYAIYQLGLHLLNGGELDRAKSEFEKIRNTDNKYIINLITLSLADIETKKAALEQKKQK